MSSDLSSKCRTCLSESSSYHQLFDYVEENYKILEMLDCIVPQIDIKTTSQFSTLVCQICVGKLLTGYKFQQLCIETNNRLHDLLGITVFETRPKLEKILDPLKAGSGLKLKEEIEEDACFETEIPTQELDDKTKSDDDRFLDNVSESDSGSSNEKLSVLKEKSQKFHLKEENLQRPPKLNRRKGYFPCTECGKFFSSLNRLKQHTAIHDKKRALSCKICNTSLKTVKTFKAHMLLHTNGETCSNNSLEHIIGNTHPESICPNLSVLDELKHEETGQENEETKCNDSKEIINFQCPDCPKVFEKKASFSAHYKVHKKKELLKNKHKNTEPSMQDIQEFETPIIMEDKLNVVDENHSKTVVKEEIEITPQMYDAANDWFSNDYEISDGDSDYELFSKPGAKETKNVDFVDTGIGEVEKPNSSNKRNGSFPCEVCGKIFDRPYRLKRHSSVHSLARPHECEICKYRFATANILKAHLFQHTNDTGTNFHTQIRPEGFKCPDCPRRFEKQASLSAHRQSHTRNTSEANYPCMVCQRSFMSIRSLTEHITNKHPEVEKHKCDQCDKTFVLHAHLVEHLNRHKGNRNLVCLICEKEFGYNNTLKEHMRTHSGESPYLCPQCGKTFRSASNLRQHMERHTGLKKYQCPECPSRFNCRSDLIKHASTHSNAKPHVCDICGSRFTRAYSLQKHKLLHSGERPFKCDQCSMTNTSEANYPCMVCQRSFMSIRSLTEHITNKHPEVEKHKCDQCDETFVLHAHLVEHLNRHKGNRNLVCLICEKEFGYNNTLKEHMRTHSGESPYLCPQCGKTFRSASNLRQHMERHAGLKKYQCPECPSRFNCRSDLIKHASTHSNAKSHVCDICGSRFTQAYSLQKHKLLHSGERPFKCDQCSMTFAIIYHLRRHMRTHTGEKPYKCKYCERAYAESGDLTKHLRTHVGENTYMCDQCPMAFKYQAELRQHQSQHYKMAQKLLQQAQKMSDAAQLETNQQTQPDQQDMQQMPLQEQQQLDHQMTKSEEMQNLSMGIPSYQQMPLLEHTQPLCTIVEETQHHTKAGDIVAPHQQENLGIKNLNM